MREKEQFITVYSNLPLGVRKEIVLVVDNQPITWEVAYIEVANDTPLSKHILMKLKELAII